jgi:hypothetical protein
MRVFIATVTVLCPDWILKYYYSTEVENYSFVTAILGIRILGDECSIIYNLGAAWRSLYELTVAKQRYSGGHKSFFHWVTGNDGLTTKPDKDNNTRLCKNQQNQIWQKNRASVSSEWLCLRQSTKKWSLGDSGQQALIWKKKRESLTTAILSVTHPAIHERGVANLEKQSQLCPFAEERASRGPTIRTPFTVSAASNRKPWSLWSPV